MVDQEYDTYLQKIAKLTKMQLILLPALIVNEYQGAWEELLESRETMIQNCDTVFSQPIESVSKETQDAIRDLEENYPILLCALGRCYIALERYSEAKEILEKAAELNSPGGKILLGMAYSESVANESDMYTALSLLKSADILAATVEREIGNKRFQESALFQLAVLYRIAANDLEASYNCLDRIANHDWGDLWNEEFHEQAFNELQHYKRGFLGSLKYIE